MKKFSLRTGLVIEEPMAWCDKKIVLAELKAYPKFMSLACLSYANLPVLPTFVFSAWNELVAQGIAGFCHDLSLEQVLVRSQKETSVFGPSYSAVPADQVPHLSRELFKTGARVVGLHPELSIHRDEYSLHIDFDFLKNLRVILEIVGPGFAATHLSRAGFVHERVYLSTFGSGCELLASKRLWSVSDEKYRRDVLKVVEKYGNDMLVKEQSLLLDHIHSYPPIPSSFLECIHRFLDRVHEAISYMSLDSERAVVSMSFFRPLDSSAIKPVFWDIHRLHG